LQSAISTSYEYGDVLQLNNFSPAFSTLTWSQVLVFWGTLIDALGCQLCVSASILFGTANLLPHERQVII